jgi:hypothetical protein
MRVIWKILGYEFSFILPLPAQWKTSLANGKTQIETTIKAHRTARKKATAIILQYIWIEQEKPF